MFRVSVARSHHITGLQSSLLHSSCTLHLSKTSTTTTLFGKLRMKKADDHPLSSVVKRPSTNRPDWSAHEAPFPGPSSKSKPKPPVAQPASYDIDLFSTKTKSKSASVVKEPQTHKLTMTQSRKGTSTIPLFVQNQLTGQVRQLPSNNRERIPSLTNAKVSTLSTVSAAKPPASSASKISAVDSNAEPPLPDDLLLNHFELFYSRSDLPLRINHKVGGTRKLEWCCNGPFEQEEAAAKCDFEKWLPIFFQGLVLTTEPHCFIATEGIKIMLEHAGPDRIVAMLPTLLSPLMTALSCFETPSTVNISTNTSITSTNTRTSGLKYVITGDRKLIVAAAFRAIEQLTRLDSSVADAMLDHYSRMLPYFNQHRKQPGGNVASDAIEYGQNNKEKVVLADLVQETLRAMEETGGAEALRRIKISMPTYESFS